MNPSTDTDHAHLPGQSTSHEDDRMLTIKEAASMLRLPEATLRYWRHLGVGPHSFRLGRHVRYWHTDVATWLYEQSRRTRQEG